MKVVVVGTNRNELREIRGKLSGIYEQEEIEVFVDPFLSAKYVYNNAVELALINAEMIPVDGITLLSVFRKEKPDLPVVIFSDTEHYQMQAKTAAADGYLIWPREEQKLPLVLEEIRERMLEQQD